MNPFDHPTLSPEQREHSDQLRNMVKDHLLSLDKDMTGQQRAIYFAHMLDIAFRFLADHVPPEYMRPLLQSYADECERLYIKARLMEVLKSTAKEE